MATLPGFTAEVAVSNIPVGEYQMFLVEAEDGEQYIYLQGCGFWKKIACGSFLAACGGSCIAFTGPFWLDCMMLCLAGAGVAGCISCIT
jgi:hypothetical protein